MSTLVASTATLGRFCRLRQEAYRTRAAGGPRMSSDDVVARHHFTNVVRAQDPGTVLGAELLRRYPVPGVELPAGQEPWQNLQRVLWSVLAYRCTNRRSTWEKFRADVGVHPYLELEDAWLRFLDDELEAGRRVFTGRHYNMGMRYYVNTLQVARGLEPDFLLRMFADAPTFTELVQELPGVGPFFGWQATADLLMTGHLPPAPDHVLLGPGAVLALRWLRDGRAFREMFNAAGRRVVGATMAHMRQDEARRLLLQLRDTQEAWLQQDGPLDQDLFDMPLTATDLEHALCEYGRWGVYHAQRVIKEERAS